MALELKFLVDNKASPEAKKLHNDLKQLNPQISNVDKSFLGLNKSLVKLGAGYLSVTKAIDFGRDFISYADEMTNVNSKLKLVTDSTMQLVDVQKELYKTSQDTRTGFSANVDLFQRMALSTKELNLSQKEQLGLVESINKSMIVSGTTAAGVDTLVTQLGQAFSSNFQAVAQELGTIRDQAPALYQALLKGTGMTSAAFKKAAEDGKLTSKIIIDALKSQATAIDSDFNKMTMTVGQSSVKVKNSGLLITETIDSITGASSSLAGMMSSLSDVLDTLNVKLKDYADNVKNVHDVHRLSTIADASRELNQLADAYNKNLKDGVGLFQSTQNYNAEIKNQEFLINSLVRKIARLTEVKKTLDQTESKKGVSNAFVPDKAESQKALNELNKLSFEIYNDYINKKLEGETQFDAHITAFYARRNELQKQATDLILSDEERINAKYLELYEVIQDFPIEKIKKFGDAWNKELQGAQKETEAVSIKIGEVIAGNVSTTLTNGVQDVLDSDYSTKKLASTIGTAVGSAITQASINASIQSSGISALATANPLLGLGIGVGAMAIGSFFGKSKSQEDVIEKEFDAFMDGLRKTSEALLQFGNVGTDIASQISTFQVKISELESKRVAEQANIATQQQIRLQSGQGGRAGKDIVEQTRESIKDSEHQIKQIEKSLSLYNKELSALLLESISSSIDYSTMSIEELQKVTKIDNLSDFNKELEEAQKTYQNTALAIKELQQTGGSADEIDALALSMASMKDEATDILNVYEDNKDAIKEMTKLEKERTDAIQEQADSIADSVSSLRLFAKDLSYQQTTSVLGFASASSFLDSSISAFSQNIQAGKDTSLELANIRKFSQDSLEYSKSQSRTSEEYLKETAIMVNKLNALAADTEETSLSTVNGTLIEIRDRLDSIEKSNLSSSIYASA